MSNQNSLWRLTFTPVDSWYFRESRPHGAAGGDRLESLFPPPVKALVGAFRSRLGDSLGIDWQAFGRGEACYQDISLNQLIGDSDSTGELEFGPAQLVYQEQLLFPWPALLMKKALNKALPHQKQWLAGANQKPRYRYARLSPGGVVHCDLGRVALAELADTGVDMAGGKVPEQDFISQGWLEAILRGETPAQSDNGIDQDVVCRDTLFTHESRLGIARNSATGTALSGMLYQTSHLRLNEQAAISLTVSGLPPEIGPQLAAAIDRAPLIRLGSEGRMAAIRLDQQGQMALPKAPKAKGGEQGLMILLLSEGDFGDTRCAPLPGFEPALTEQEQTVWRGQLHGIALELHCVMAGKAVRRGGWDLKNRRPGTMKSHTPAGSCYFLKLTDGTSLHEAIDRLHGQAIGAGRGWGYGRIACGLWR